MILSTPMWRSLGCRVTCRGQMQRPRKKETSQAMRFKSCSVLRAFIRLQFGQSITMPVVRLVNIFYNVLLSDHFIAYTFSFHIATWYSAQPDHFIYLFPQVTCPEINRARYSVGTLYMTVKLGISDHKAEIGNSYMEPQWCSRGETRRYKAINGTISVFVFQMKTEMHVCVLLIEELFYLRLWLCGSRCRRIHRRNK